jgi:hypothetical protein
LYAFGNVDEGTIAENGRIKGSKIVVANRNDAADIFLNQFGMFL